MGKVQPTCSNNKEFNLYSMQVSPQKWKLSFWFIFQKNRAPASPRCNQKSMVWMANMLYYFLLVPGSNCMHVIGLDKIFFYNLFSVVRAPGFLVRYRICIGTKLKNIYIFLILPSSNKTIFRKKKSWWMIIGNYDVRTPT